jgi:hypothetical protein
VKVVAKTIMVAQTSIKLITKQPRKSSQKPQERRNLGMSKFIEKEVEYTLAYSEDEKAFIAFAPVFNLLCKGNDELEAVTELKNGIISLLNDTLQDAPVPVSFIKVELERKHR